MPSAPLIRDGDGMLFFNFRADRARELTQAFMEDGFTGFERKKQPKVDYVCMTEYKDTFHLPIVFPPEPLTNILGDVCWRRTDSSSFALPRPRNTPTSRFSSTAASKSRSPARTAPRFPHPRWRRTTWLPR